MSSSIAYDPAAPKKVIAGASPSLGGDASARVARLGMSPRQQALNILWARYRAQHYENRRWDWNGREVLSPLDREAVSSGASIPPGFYDAGGQMVPLAYRRPTAPYHLGRVIVNRFTGLLFSTHHHPEVRVEGDPDTEDFLQGIVEVSRIWAKFIEARTYGGATGSVAVGFQFVDGKPRIEVHDPRWCVPDFEDREQLLLRSLEKRYVYLVEKRDSDTGEWREVPYWYRRLIDRNKDVVFKSVPVGDGEEPKWEVEKQVDHDFGFCPVVWIQNETVDDDVDGDPDCHGVFDMLDAMDALLAQANTGTLGNCDPTLIIRTDAPLAGINKGSDNAIKVPATGNGDVKYLEITGNGPKSARELAAEFRTYVLEVTQCVLDQPNQAAAATATEIERRYSSMLERADKFREQYGERGLKPLLEMMVRGAQVLQRPKIVEGSARPVVQVLQLPMRSVADPADPSRVTKVARKLGPGGNISLQWPDYFLPSVDDVQKKVTASVAAVAGKLVDQQHGAQYVAPAFGVKDVPTMLAKIAQEAAAEQAELERLATSGVSGQALGTVAKTGVATGNGAGSEDEDEPAAAPPIRGKRPVPPDDGAEE